MIETKARLEEQGARAEPSLLGPISRAGLGHAIINDVYIITITIEIGVYIITIPLKIDAFIITITIEIGVYIITMPL